MHRAALLHINQTPMKTLTSLQKYFFFILVSALTAKAQTLSPGDIAIVGFNFDNTDQIAFVALTEIPSGTEIKFTDDGWLSTGSFRGSEESFTPTQPRLQLPQAQS